MLYSLVLNSLRQELSDGIQYCNKFISTMSRLGSTSMVTMSVLVVYCIEFTITSYVSWLFNSVGFSFEIKLWSSLPICPLALVKCTGNSTFWVIPSNTRRGQSSLHASMLWTDTHILMNYLTGESVQVRKTANLLFWTNCIRHKCHACFESSNVFITTVDPDCSVTVMLSADSRLLTTL